MSESEDFQQVLSQKFPDMKPVKSTPALFSINGFGLGMSGKRNFDAETATYVKTHCLTALFIPVFSFGSYRVADAEGGGWYFLGKVEKSGFSKIWNLLVMAAIGSGWWAVHTNSPEYRAAEALEKAQAQTADGQTLAAAETYREMIFDQLPQRQAAEDGLRDAVNAALSADPPEAALQAVKFVCRLPVSLVGKGRTLGGVSDQVSKIADRLAAEHPEVALEVLSEVGKLPMAPADLAERRENLLRQLTIAEPTKPYYAVELASILEGRGEVDEAYAVLEPHIEGLGSGDGSRILGQILLARGQAAEAVPLLENYIEPRLKKWRAAEKRYNRAAEVAYQRVIDQLNRGEGPKSFFTEYEKAKNEEEQGLIVDNYVYEKMPAEPSYKKAIEEYEKTAEIVPVIMDLAISELQVAQAITDSVERKAMLDKAEEHFLSLESAAGDSAEFKFFLGQVYYWSGRQDEGRALFDELLKAGERDFQTLLTLSSTLREIGDTGESRELAEEAYEKATTADERDGAASQRALLYQDVDDQIVWLEKITARDLNFTTRLAEAYAQKALSEGKNAEAIKQLRIAEDGWSKLPVSSSTLNNGALVQFELFELTGEIDAYAAGSQMMERAVELQPDSSILVGNASSSLASTALMQVLEGRLHPRLIQEGVDLDSLRYFYTDEIERNQVQAALAKNENFQRSLEFLNRAMLLAPNSKDLYGRATGVYSYFQDAESLKNVVRLMSDATIDHGAGKAAHAKFVSGEDDEKLRDGFAAALKNQTELLEGIDDENQRRHVEVAMAALRTRLFFLGEVADLDKEIETLSKASQEDPCVGHTSVLVTALFQEAAGQLAEQSAAFAKILKDGRRHIGPRDMIILALISDELRPVVMASKAARAAMAADMKYNEPFPASRSAEMVIISAYFAQERTDAFRAEYRNNRVAPLDQKVAELMTPYVPATHINAYFHAIADERQADAEAIFKKAQEEGVWMPEI